MNHNVPYTVVPYMVVPYAVVPCMVVSYMTLSDQAAKLDCSSCVGPTSAKDGSR